LSERFEGSAPIPCAFPARISPHAWEQFRWIFRKPLKLAHRRIFDYHQRQKPQDISVSGVHAETARVRRWRRSIGAGPLHPAPRPPTPARLMNAVTGPVAGVSGLVNGDHRRAGTAWPIRSCSPAATCGGGGVLPGGEPSDRGAWPTGNRVDPAVDVISPAPGNLLREPCQEGGLMAWLASTPSPASKRVLVIADHRRQPQQVADDLLPSPNHDPLAASHPAHHQCGPVRRAVPGLPSRQLLDQPPRRGLPQCLRDWGLICLPQPGDAPA